VVVDLTVEDDPHTPIFIPEWLMASSDIDDAKPPHGKADIPIQEKTLIVGAAMCDLVAHHGENVSVNILACIWIKDAADSAHG